MELGARLLRDLATRLTDIEDLRCRISVLAGFALRHSDVSDGHMRTTSR